MKLTRQQVLDLLGKVLLDKGDQIWYSYVLEGAEFPENGIVHADGF